VSFVISIRGETRHQSLYTRSFSSEDNHPGRSDYTFEARAGRRQPEPSPSPRSKGGGPLTGGGGVQSDARNTHGAKSRRAVRASGRLRRLDPDQRRRVVDHVRGRHERVEGQVVGAALRLVPVLLAREEPQPPPGGSRAQCAAQWHLGVWAGARAPPQPRLVSPAAGALALGPPGGCPE
jgi:hypothetical protein